MGVHKNIQTPTDLMKLYTDYVQELKDNPRIQNVANYGKVTELGHVRPQTMKGFNNYCRLQGKSSTHYFVNTDNRYNEFIDVCFDIKQSIEADMLELALVGMCKEAMCSKILGLNTPVQIDSNGVTFEFS
jgi:hypothetical protein